MLICWHFFGSRSQADSGMRSNSAGSEKQDQARCPQETVILGRFRERGVG